MTRERLHEKERRPRVDGVKPIPQRQIGVEQRSAVGEGGGIGQRVDMAELLQRAGENPRRGVGVLEVGGDELAGAPCRSISAAAAAPFCV